MALTGVLRPGIIQLRVLDMDDAIVHYRDRLGLQEVMTGDDGRVYLKGWDEFDHHSVVLREADEAGMDLFAFKVADTETLDQLAADVAAYGFEVSDVPAGEQPGVGLRKSFEIQSGHTIQLYAEVEQAEKTPTIVNPDVWPEEPRGMGVNRFDHALLYGPDIDQVTDFFCSVLGFSVAETAETPGGIAVWLTCSNKAHDIAFVPIPDPNSFHHVAFFLEEQNHVTHAGDVMAFYDIPIDVGPTRHGITRGRTIYFFDPSGNRNEVFAGGYTYYPDNPTRSWTADQIGKGIFYYERELNEAFLSVYT
ncbi:MAG: catechol 2,3-dioxygenase [Ilumatobacter sp.]|uniref:catechol 2,3-dioxygenase n=1 Tax=Ilumatobacter sp. TaxID=1967498 RepID=UPI002609A9E2|nr:catechol 2,3-dioxygenase [Ilumatobacter sp.]MDJ0768482.1 catechol 2,3-dioxygenase [Ilumatobacter sp.]